MSDQAQSLQVAVTADATGEAIQPSRRQGTFQAIISGSGDVSATVTIYGSNSPPNGNTGTHGIVLGTISLSGTDSATDGFVVDAPWKWVWSAVSDLSGTGASVDVLLGL